MRRVIMNKFVRAFIEWLAYVVAAIAIGSVFRVTIVVKPTAQASPPVLYTTQSLVDIDTLWQQLSRSPYRRNARRCLK